MDSLRKTLLPPAVDSVESNAYRLCHELMRMGRFEDAAFAARSLTPTELSSLDCDGNNLLHHAAASGSLELVEVVMDGLNSPDEIATRSKQGSALWIAMEGGHEEAACAIAQRVCAEHLLDIEKYGSTALDYARGRQLTGLQSIIIRKLSTLADTLPANTLLRYQLLAQATGCNQRDVAREIIASLDSKVDTVAWEPDTLCQLPGMDGCHFSTTPIESPSEFFPQKLFLIHLCLTQSIHHGWAEEAIALVDQLPDAWLIWPTIEMDITRLVEPYSALFAAARHGSADVMQKLMDRSGPRCLDLINQDGDNILHVAAHFNKKEVCDLIINKVDSSYLGLQDRSGNTALHTAIYGSSRDSHSIPCQLVDQMNPADLSLLNSNSFTPLMLCIKFSHSHGISDACKLIERMRTEDLLRPNEGSDTYLKETMRAGAIGIADALRQHMDPQQFSKIAADLYLEAPDDDWKILLTPVSQNPLSE